MNRLNDKSIVSGGGFSVPLAEVDIDRTPLRAGALIGRVKTIKHCGRSEFHWIASNCAPSVKSIQQRHAAASIEFRCHPDCNACDPVGLKDKRRRSGGRAFT